MGVIRALQTQNKAVAQRKLARLVAELDASEEGVGRSETFQEAVERVYLLRKTNGVKSADEEVSKLRRFANPMIGTKEVTQVTPPEINSVLDDCKAQGKSRETTKHVLQTISNVFARLKREGVIQRNPASDAEMPDYPRTTKKRRAVLTDYELTVYLAYEHKQERWRIAVLEHQVMSLLSRTFGGLRTGDLHTLRWGQRSIFRILRTAGRLERKQSSLNYLKC